MVFSDYAPPFIVTNGATCKVRRGTWSCLAVAQWGK